jgi:hypothetical protein
MNLETIATFYSQYFLTVASREAGPYTVHYGPVIFSKPWVNISRPGEDWCLIIEQDGDHYLCRLAECWAGTELCQFSFKQVDALVDLFPIFQQQIEVITEANYRDYLRETLPKD